jgi:hypothetical protein
MRPSVNLEASDRGRASNEPLAWRHHRFGWWSLFVFATLGLVLESLAGLRVGWYVDAGNETRHTMMRLAHAHGSLLAIINVVFSHSVRSTGHAMHRLLLASACLVAATISIPLGFALGGVWFYEADPGLGILLVPLGAVALLVAIAHVAGTSSSPT